MDRLSRDLRHAVRMLLKTPVFTSVVVFTLAVGIGANTAMFSIVNGVLLRGLPFPEPERIVKVYSTSQQFPRMSSSYPNFLDWAERQREDGDRGEARGLQKDADAVAEILQERSHDAHLA